MSWALLELGQYETGKERKQYVEAAEKMLCSLSSDAYLAKLGEMVDFFYCIVQKLCHYKEVDVP